MIKKDAVCDQINESHLSKGLIDKYYSGMEVCKFIKKAD